MRERGVTYRDTFRQSLELAKFFTDREARSWDSGNTPWESYYGSPVAAYNKEFSLVQTMPIEDRLRLQRAKKGSVAVMDVMGTTDYTAVAPVDRQVHMTLVNWDAGVQEPSSPNTVVID